MNELQSRMRAFIDETVIPAESVLLAGGPAAEAAMAQLQGTAQRDGLWALGHPAEIGGGGLPFMEYVLVNEIIGRSYFGQLATGTSTTQDSIMLQLFGTAAQRERWLDPMVAGRVLPCVAMTEPDVAGSDPTQIRSHASLDGDEWVVNAHKWFTTGASRAGFTTVFARTEPAGVDAHRALSAILVPMDTPGLKIDRVLQTMGTTLGDHCEISLTDVRVPVDSLVGARGDGFVVAQRRLGPGRIFHCMRWLGQAQRAFELMCDRAKSRFAHGSYLAEKGEIQRYIAESAAEIQAARLMTLDAARAYDLDGRAAVEISLIKFWGARMLHNVIDRAIQVHGALGLTEDTPLDLMYREARYARIYDGPDEVHRMVVARRILADQGKAPWNRSEEPSR
ncbi:alkylation response protein AidB-like acyl-CoA dehydrogenase [Jatrophihabitans sp. GAS493]|uniref:acyl-CoA dehydrogenase family protein n=1 Tax=Jatrophihabitans sp. GAS493 TaxID=1907575 RepID=UPI000BB9064B|nr:acyl-CoA dehydrogenase family protein [Jatrophihabitans sp. GAS493]SOD74618.1 alkylation response protein AidB-like acyl-CoA dehydrogenase [Jatrophihabitans sp. GAS493]